MLPVFCFSKILIVEERMVSLKENFSLLFAPWARLGHSERNDCLNESAES
jgi:hypothetical protein